MCLPYMGKKEERMQEMGIYKLQKGQMGAIAPLFEGWEESLIWSCLQGCMGEAWADKKECPKSARILLADFCYFAGEASQELVVEGIRNQARDFVIMVPPLDDAKEGWASEIERAYGSKCKRVERYAIKKEPGIFDKAHLEGIVRELKEGYEVKLIDQEIFAQTRKQKWSMDFTSQFADYGDYHKRGLGAAVVANGELVSGASSYTVYQEGIEIEIGTRQDYRRKGLASVCGARLILECMERGLYPSWDAQNLWSVKLAEKLGYHFDRAYPAYEVFV